MNKKTTTKKRTKKENPTRRNQNIRDYLEASVDPDTLFAEDFDDAIIGVTYDSRIVYDIDQMIEILMKDNITYEEALEYLEFNTFGAYMGPMTPIYMYPKVELIGKRKR